MAKKPKPKPAIKYDGQSVRLIEVDMLAQAQRDMRVGTKFGNDLLVKQAKAFIDSEAFEDICDDLDVGPDLIRRRIDEKVKIEKQIIMERKMWEEPKIAMFEFTADKSAGWARTGKIVATAAAIKSCEFVTVKGCVGIGITWHKTYKPAFVPMTLIHWITFEYDLDNSEDMLPLEKDIK